MTREGNPRCRDCHGKGGFYASGRWVVCSCMKPHKSVTELLRKYNARADRPYRSPFTR